VGIGGEGDVGPGVDQQARWAGGQVDGLEEFTGYGGEGSGGEIFFAKLDEVDVVGDPAGGFCEEGGLLFLFAAGIEGAAGDGVANHGQVSVWCQGPFSAVCDVGVVVSSSRANPHTVKKLAPHDRHAGADNGTRTSQALECMSMSMCHYE